MNAPASQLLAAPTLEFLPLNAIVPSNTPAQLRRRARFSRESLIELATSIRTNGVLQPILVRPLGFAKFELVAGERRWEASKIAEQSTIPASVRELTDTQVLEAQLVENLQREGLHELEEAEGYHDLMELKKIGAEDLVEMVGRSRSYIYARLKLLALNETGREAFYRGEIDASRALYVARITNPKLQEKALALATEKNWKGTDPVYSVRTLREKLTGNGFSIPLSLASFDQAGTFHRFEKIPGKRGMEDAIELPKCAECPQRTGNCLDLFTQGDDPDVCTDTACFQLKTKEHAVRVRKQAEAEGRTILTGDEAKMIAPRKDKLVGHIDLDERCDHDPYPEPEPDMKTFGDDEEAYEAACEAWSQREMDYKGRTFRELFANAAIEPVLLEDPKDKRIRELVPLKEAAKLLKAHKITLPSWEYAPEPKREHHTPQDYAAQRKAEDERRKIEAKKETEELAARTRIAIEIRSKWSGLLKREDFVAIADALCEDGHWTREGLKAIYGKVPEPGQLKDPELHKFIAITLVAECCARAHVQSKPLLELAKRLKIDVNKVRKGEAAAGEKPAAAKAKAKPKAPAKKASGKAKKK